VRGATLCGKMTRSVRYWTHPCGKGKVIGQVRKGEMQAEREVQESVARPFPVDTDTGEVRMEPD
jgi:hypothetical protein